jgi:CRP/FNR family transcriptional regulator, dissimilatory nitrate respiration regulator
MILIMSDLFNSVGPRYSEIRLIAAGQHLFRRDDPVVAFHEVVSGEITLERVSVRGARLVLHRAKPGELLAEASLYADKYHCDACAITQSEVRSIGIAALRTFLGRNPDALSRLMRHLAHQIQHARFRAEMLSMKRLSERLEAWLLMNDNHLPPKGEWRPLAAELGITPEALYRELARRR